MPLISPERYRVDAGWDDAPHLDEAQKVALDRSTPPHMREARRTGRPSQGEGAIYPFDEAEITCPPFAIPSDWRRGFGLDVGWNWTAGVWLAESPNDMMLYAYAEHKPGQANIVTHASAIKARGATLRGAVDPAANLPTADEGERVKMQYADQGVMLVNAVNAVEAGIATVWLAFQEGRLKIFTTCVKTLAERRQYHRRSSTDRDGVKRVRIVKKEDHLLDALRYGVMTWEKIATVPALRIGAGMPTARAIDERAGL